MSFSGESFDYIVVGGGSAGCVVAGELCGETRLEVALIEQGDDAEVIPRRLRPTATSTHLPTMTCCSIASAPHRSIAASTGSFWAQVAVSVAAARSTAWSTRAARRKTTRAGRAAISTTTWRPFSVAGEQASRAPPGSHRVYRDLREGGRVAGFRRSENMNDGDLSGVIGYETMNYEGPSRRSSYVSYLREARQRPNLHVLTRAVTRRVVFEGNRASAWRSTKVASGESCVPAARSSCAPVPWRHPSC